MQMTDVENFEQLIQRIFGVEKHIANRKSSNACLATLNRRPLNLFASNFINRIERLARRYSGQEIEEICEKLKNIGEADSSTQSGAAKWIGPYSELVALDFYSQFMPKVQSSYISRLPIREHKNSIPARIGRKELIDIDIKLDFPQSIIYTDVKSFNCVHQEILDKVFEKVEDFAAKKCGKTVLLGVDNLSSLDYKRVKNSLGQEKRKIETELEQAVKDGHYYVIYRSRSGLVFNFKINYRNTLTLTREYSPYSMAEAYRYKFVDYGSKLVDNEYSIITMVRNPWFNREIVDFGNFNNYFYRALSRRTFIELADSTEKASEYSSEYGRSSVTVGEISRSLAGLIFIDDKSMESKDFDRLYNAYIYLNPNYGVKPPLTVQDFKHFVRSQYKGQLKDLDDFSHDNY